MRKDQVDTKLTGLFAVYNVINSSRCSNLTKKIHCYWGVNK